MIFPLASKQKSYESPFNTAKMAEGQQMTPMLETALKEQIAKEIGKFAIPEEIRFAPKLPKTRSGKIMRRILRCLVTGELDKMGDISTKSGAVLPL